MEEIFILFLFVLPALLSLASCFIKDLNKKRGIILNTVLVINALVYLSPLIYAYWATRPDGNMWNENGPGAIIWLYFIILPVCVLVLITVFILKLLFRKKPQTEPANKH